MNTGIDQYLSGIKETLLERDNIIQLLEGEISKKDLELKTLKQKIKKFKDALGNL